MSFPKKAAFYAILALIILVASEMVSSAFLFFAYKDQISGLSGEPFTPSTVLVLRKGLNWLLPGSAPDPLPYRRMTRIPQDFFAEDAEQGYRAKPGRYIFRYTRRQGGALEHLDSVVTINGDGTRFTGNAPAAPARQIHVLGDSFVFGDGVNDEQTFSFLLQSAFPRDAVHLHALSGYSWANALVTMERIKDQIRPGDIVILGYAFYYKERHVAAPGRLRDISSWMARSFPDVELSPKDRLIRARLDGANLVLDTIPMYCKFNPDYCSGVEPSAGRHRQGVDRTPASHRGEEQRADLPGAFLRPQGRPRARQAARQCRACAGNARRLQLRDARRHHGLRRSRRALLAPRDLHQDQPVDRAPLRRRRTHQPQPFSGSLNYFTLTFCRKAVMALSVCHEGGLPQL